MGKTRYRVEDNTPSGMAKRKAKKALPLALLGLGGYALWQSREQVSGWFEALKSKLGGGEAARSGVSVAEEVIPADYDRNRPSVFNSTAMAGPRDGAGGTEGLEGGTLGTEPGTQGEGAL